MATPTTRDEFKAYVLRDIGYPVIEINVDDDQVEDRVDEALRYYMDYHFDGTHHTYYKYQITQADKDNGYITLPDSIIGAVDLFPIGEFASSTNNFFNIRYQIILNDLYTITAHSIQPYYIQLQYLQLLEEILVGKQPIRYNRHMNRLYIDVDWTKLEPDHYVVVSAYEVVDPDVFADVWKDRWLFEYTSALVRRQWGRNLTKFVGMQLPGGVQFNGEQILQDAQRDLDKLREEMIVSYSLPVADMIG